MQFKVFIRKLMLIILHRIKGAQGRKRHLPSITYLFSTILRRDFSPRPLTTYYYFTEIESITCLTSKGHEKKNRYENTAL